MEERVQRVLQRKWKCDRQRDRQIDRKRPDACRERSGIEAHRQLFPRNERVCVYFAV